MINPPVIDTELLTKQHYYLRNDERIDIRFATGNDLEEIMEIQKACYGGKAPWGRMAVMSEVKNKKNSFFIICFHNFDAIAFISASYRGVNLHITNIATVPSYQKQGIGTFLIQQVARIGRQLDCEFMTLEVRMSNEPAKSLYRTLGFIDGNVKKNYYHDNREDALNMAYKLEKVDDYEDIQPVK